MKVAQRLQSRVHVAGVAKVSKSDCALLAALLGLVFLKIVAVNQIGFPERLDVVGGCDFGHIDLHVLDEG